MSTSNHRGIYTSLYAALSDETVGHVESAVWLKLTGQTGAARAIFDGPLKPLEHLPLVALEHADLELESGRWGRAWRILDSAIRVLQSKGADMNLPQHRLMMLEKAMLGTRHRGDLASAVVELERAREWLREVSVDEYTDLQASCVRRYVITYLFVRLGSNYQNADIESVPKASYAATATASPKPWDGLHDLRRSLTDRGMLMEANALFRVEFNRTPLQDREPVAEEFLNAISTVPTSHRRNFIEAVVRLQWSTTYLQLANAARLLEEIGKSEAALDRWCAECEIPDKSAVPHSLEIMFAKLDLIFDHATKLALAEQLVAEMRKHDFTKTGSCIDTATVAAFALYEKTGNDEYLTKFFALHDQLRQYDETISEDLCDLVQHRCSCISATLRTLIDRQKSLEWIEGFLKQYPYFASSTDLSQLHNRKASLLRALRRLDEAKAAEALAEMYESGSGTPAQWMHLSRTNIIVPRTRDNGANQYDSEDENERTPFFWSWASVVGDKDKGARYAVDLLLDFLLEDVVAGRLAIDELQSMTGISDAQPKSLSGDDAANYKEQLKCRERAKLHRSMFPFMATCESPQEDRCAHICDWLARYPKGQRNRRLFCLLMLRDSRQYHFADLNLWECQITELRCLLEFFPNLPAQIREICRGRKGFWLAQLSLIYTQQVLDAPQLEDQAVYDKILDAERYCDQALGELGENTQLEQIALQHRNAAQLCLLKARRLKHLQDTDGREPNQMARHVEDAHFASSLRARVEKELAQIRTKGLEKIKVADEIFTTSELEASWSQGLKGINERHGMSTFYSNFMTIGVAITLLLGQEPARSDDTIKQIWWWVQKYKARSLARTVGRRNLDPFGLVKEIVESEQCRPMYEEMLNLDEQIKAAKPNQRFELRQRLDRHRHSMRKHALLRRLLDLREGAPFDMFDIKAIDAQAGTPVVLVDWFYLPPFLSTDSGKLLLLTARADNSVPTLDILSTEYETVAEWIRNSLRTDRLCLGGVRSDFDKKLNSLVAPLADRTAPGDILVFCPSAMLHKLPLHALSLPASEESGSRVLIRRNPVIYSHSHSLLRSCLSTIDLARSAPSLVRPQFLAGIPEAASANYGVGRKCIRELATWFDEPALLDADASKKQFMQQADQVRLLHMHTHCCWDFGDPLNHHLAFPVLDDAAAQAAAQDYKLTAGEVFDMRLVPGTHVNMIACQGGVTDVRPGDEVLGLVPAFLCSGASSTVSTLWSIGDAHGAEFSKLFFQSFLDQCSELQENTGGINAVGVVDLAMAFQDAVIGMDPDEDQPLYRWAGYVMHGFWQFPLGEDDLKALATEAHDKMVQSME